MAAPSNEGEAAYEYTPRCFDPTVFIEVYSFVQHSRPAAQVFL